VRCQVGVAEATGLIAELLIMEEWHGYIDYSAEGDVSGPEADEPVRSGGQLLPDAAERHRAHVYIERPDSGADGGE
jgi:hypothetical protein